SRSELGPLSSLLRDMSIIILELRIAILKLSLAWEELNEKVGSFSSISQNIPGIGPLLKYFSVLTELEELNNKKLENRSKSGSSETIMQDSSLFSGVSSFNKMTQPNIVPSNSSNSRI